MKRLMSKLLVIKLFTAVIFIPPGILAQSTNDYSVCQGITEPYWIQNPGSGSTFTWTINPGASGTDWTIVANNNDSINVLWILPGIYTVQSTETSSFGCIGDPIQLHVTVIQLPTTANAGQDQTLCGILTTTMQGNTPSIGTGEWSQISGPGSITFTNVNNPSTLITASFTGTYVLRWTITNGTCPVSSDDVTITMSPAITVTATSNSPVCEGATMELYCDIAGATYSWTGPGGWISNLQNPTRTNALPSMTGTYNVVVSNVPGGCPDTSDTIDITVNPKPLTNGIWHN